ncbi:MAG: hypothetical protein ACRDRR_12365 [Pseudonocardiaceae bacterium]
MTEGRNYHGAYLMLLTVAFATTAWLSRSEQQVIAATFRAWSQHLWYGGLVGGALPRLAVIARSSIRQPRNKPGVVAATRAYQGAP